MTRVAAVQMCSGTDVDANLRSACGLIGEARETGARVVVLPENFSVMAGDAAERARAALGGAGEETRAVLAGVAREHGIWVVAGSVPYSVDDKRRQRSACLVFDDSGALVARYDKMHLFDVRVGPDEAYRESDDFEPGDDLVVVDTPCGRLGLTICYDVRFPELYRALGEQGAQWFAVPSAFTVPTGRAHWEVLLRARAIENLAYVVAPAQSGLHANGRQTWGHAMIVDPWGEVQACRESGEGVVWADIDLERLATIRDTFPALSHRRLTVAAAAQSAARRNGA